jgi:phosphatidylserine/phosphatidylglycerophosphate/cardiolipin synthase-like enzyme
VDGKYAVLGSANFSRPALFNNREINAYVSDPTVVARLTDVFQNDLLIAGLASARTDTLFYKDTAKAVTFNTDSAFQLIESAPWQFDNPEILNILDVLTNAIQRAQTSIKGEIYLYNSANTNSPYIEKNLFAAMKRGVEVRLVANKNTFTETDDYGNYRYADYRHALARAATNGARIRLIDTQKLFPNDFSTTHSKVLIVDDRFLVIQSANWTASSVYDNREVGIFTKDPGMLGQMLRIYERDWNFSEDYAP